MKVLKIDAEKQEVYEVDIDPTLQGVYAAIGNNCDTIERIPDPENLPGGMPHDLWLDEEGLYKDITYFFTLLTAANEGNVYKGNGIVAGKVTTEEGERMCDHSMDIEKLKLKIAFFTEIEQGGSKHLIGHHEKFNFIFGTSDKKFTNLN